MSSLQEFDGNSKLGLIIVSSRFLRTSSVRTFDENNSLEECEKMIDVLQEVVKKQRGYL